MIEMCCLKNVVILFTNNFQFCAVKKNHVYNNLAWKYRNVMVKDFRKYEKLQYKNDKLKLDIDFLNNCKQLGVYLKFLIFKLLNVSNKDASSICKRFLRSAINNHNKELQHVLKELSICKNFLPKQLSTNDFYIVKNL